MAIWLRQQPFIKCGGCSSLSCEAKPTRPEPSSAARTSGLKRRHMFSAHRNACLMRATNRTVQRRQLCQPQKKRQKKLLHNAEGGEDKRGFPSNSLGVLNWDKQRLLRRQKPLLHIPSGRLQILRFIAHEQHLLFLYCQFITGSRGGGGLEK